jgi:hypothetical protein
MRGNAKLRWWWVCIYAFAWANNIQAQWRPESLLQYPAIVAADSNRLSLVTDMTGFFKNNEYFSPVAVGQTYPGIALTTALVYQAGGIFRAEAGAYAVKFSGRNNFSSLQAFLRLQYAITPSFNMVVGNLYGGVNHRLIEPLYQWERHYTANPESGLQFVLDNDRWFADIWVDWQRYIERNDNFPEALAFGLSASWQATDPESRYHLSLPLQLLIQHHGGQIDVSDEPMIVLGNLATGLCARVDMNSRWMQSIGLDVYATGYYDRYPNESLRPFGKGWGIYPVLHVHATRFSFLAGYWYAEKFYAFQGESLFGTFNFFAPLQQMPIRSMLTLKVVYEQKLYKSVSLGVHMETYTDMKRRKMDYSFGIHIRFTPRFLLFGRF